MPGRAVELLSMRFPIAIAALTLAGCSSGSGPSQQTRADAQASPRPEASQVNFPGAQAGGASAATGSSSSGGPAVSSNESPAGSVSAASGSVGSDPGARRSTPRRPPIEPGLWRMPGYQPSLRVTNLGSDTLARGYNLYQANCSMCHGADLRGELSAPGLPVRDLTKMKRYKFGSSDQAIYRTIVYGIPKTAMGNSRESLSAQQVWDVINYMKSKRTD